MTPRLPERPRRLATALAAVLLALPLSSPAACLGMVLHAHRGDPAAWQALLGLNGEPRNAEEAGRWLDRADAGTRTSAAWKAARAAQVLHQESMPDDIRKAKAELAEAGDQGLAEARYWLARIHLSPQAPERDERLGLRLLAQAADAGHAHAALLLGSKLAKGDGMPRNTAKARPYLYRAAAAGLPEAQPLLDGLR